MRAGTTSRWVRIEAERSVVFAVDLQQHVRAAPPGHGLALRTNDRTLGVMFLIRRSDQAMLRAELCIADAFHTVITTVVEDQIRIAELERRLAGHPTC